jgi:acetylserotonin N-methyltransferase
VLHNLQDGAAAALLARVHTALSTDGAVLLAERLMDGAGASVSMHMHSLNMLICTGGRERSVGEYRHLLTAAGFADIRSKVTGAWLDAMIGLKTT